MQPNKSGSDETDSGTSNAKSASTSKQLGSATAKTVPEKLSAKKPTSTKRKVQHRYPRVIGLSEPIPIRNADVFTTKISADLVRSVRYWPKNTGLQIDMFSTKANEFIITLCQIGDYFPDWLEDIVSICSEICKMSTVSKKWHTEKMKHFKAKEVYELLPASDAANFIPSDFKVRTDYSHAEFEMMSPSDAHEVNANYFRTRNVVPESRIIDTSELASKIASVPGTLVRTVLAPTDEERANEVRTEVFNSEIHSHHVIDANASVVDIRCFVMANYQVPIGLKRLLTSMATDTVLSSLSNNEIKNVLANPLDSIKNFSRICLSAAALIRIPVIEYAVVKEAKNTIRNIENDIKMREELKSELKKELIKEFEALLIDNNKQLLQIIHNNAQEILFSDSLGLDDEDNDSIALNAKSFKRPPENKGVQWQ